MGDWVRSNLAYIVGPAKIHAANSSSINLTKVNFFGLIQVPQIDLASSSDALRWPMAHL
jgi:hypothetical protein